MSSNPLPLVTPHDLSTDQEVRWCPGCGDFSVLAQFKKALADVGVPRERVAIISSVGCAARLPFYVNTYGFHGLAGGACAVATGLKAIRPELSVWVIMGDGDGLGAGATSLIHTLRRNVDVKILLFNNEVLGLSKGQASATSRPGTRTRTTPDGSVGMPLRPLALALASEASFAARSIDVDAGHLGDILRRAALHRGSAFIEVYQNCNVFNDGAFEFATDRTTKADSVIYLEHGKPLIYGKDRTRGIRVDGFALEQVSLEHGEPLDDVLVHDEAAAEPTLALALSRLQFPEQPECFGVFRAVQRPTFEEVVRRSEGQSSLEELLTGTDAWDVEGPAT